MGVEMMQLFQKYKSLNKKRDEVYAKVYAEMDSKRRSDKLRKAKSLDTQLSSVMYDINRQAGKEGIPTKRSRAKKVKFKARR